MKSRLHLRRRSLALLGCLLFGTAALAIPAQAGTPVVESPAPTQNPPPDKFLETLFAFSATNYFDTSFDSSPLSLSVTRYALYSQFKFRLSPDWMLKIFPYGDISLYSFHTDNPFFGAPPQFTKNLRNAYFMNVDATIAYHFAPLWAIVVGGRLTSGASTEANFSDSITGGGILGLKRTFWNNAVDFTFGVSYTSRLARSWQVFPYLDFDVNVLPSFVKMPINLRLLYNGGLLSYRVTDSLALTLQGRYDSRAYRMPALLQFQNGAKQFPNAVWYEYGLELGAGFTYAPRRANWALSFTGGYEVFRNVQIVARNGFKFFDQDVNPTPFVQATFHAAF